MATLNVKIADASFIKNKQQKLSFWLSFFIAHFLLIKRIKFHMKKVINCCIVILSSIIGVGFVSGQELLVFFARFGLFGCVCSIFAGVLFGLAVAYFLYKPPKLASKTNFKKPQNLLKTSEKRYQNDKNIKISAIFNKVLLVAYVVISAAMISGFRALLLSFMPALFVEVILFLMLGLLFVLLIKELKFVQSISKIFMFLFAIIFILLFAVNIDELSVKFNPNVNMIFVLCQITFYVSMNVFTSMPIIISYGKNFSKKECVVVGIVCGVLCGVFILMGSLVLSGKTFESEIPLLELVNFNVLKIVYVLVVFVGLVTTLFSTVLGAVTLCGGAIKHYVLVLYFSYILSSFGFSGIVGRMYPLVGFFSMLALIIMFLMVKSAKFDNCV